MVPVVSVMPYSCTKPQPNTSMHSFSNAAGIGEAPYSMYFSLEKSTCRARRLPHHELHRGGHHEQFGNAGLFEEIQHLGGIELARDDALGAMIEAHHAPARAADMEDRHRDQRDVIRRPLVPVGLRSPPVSTRLRKLACDSIAPLACRWCPRYRAGSRCPCGRSHRGVVAALGIAPGDKILPFRRAAFGGDNAAQVRQLRFDVANLADELRPHEQHRRLAIADDKSDFGSGQPPVHRRHHHIGLHRPKQELEIDVAVLAEIGDALARLDAEGFERVGDTVGLDIEFGKTGLASLEFKCGGVAAALCPRAQPSRQGLPVLQMGTCFSRNVYCSLLRILASRRAKDNTPTSSLRKQAPIHRGPSIG
jgi:hypothetical protein